jgi:hypothetical protein
MKTSRFNGPSIGGALADVCLLKPALGKQPATLYNQLRALCDDSTSTSPLCKAAGSFRRPPN